MARRIDALAGRTRDLRKLLRVRKICGTGSGLISANFFSDFLEEFAHRLFPLLRRVAEVGFCPTVKIPFQD
jgi:hypothetical protein